jgi:hypothetical protein
MARFSVGQNFEIVLELTVCFEINLLKLQKYKKNRYAYLKENIIDKSKEVYLIFLVVPHYSRDLGTIL